MVGPKNYDCAATTCCPNTLRANIHTALLPFFFEIRTTRIMCLDEQFPRRPKPSIPKPQPRTRPDSTPARKAPVHSSFLRRQSVPTTIASPTGTTNTFAHKHRSSLDSSSLKSRPLPATPRNVSSTQQQRSAVTPRSPRTLTPRTPNVPHSSNLRPAATAGKRESLGGWNNNWNSKRYVG